MASIPPPNKHACVTCVRRKVKCDKADPCSNCHKARTQCVYRAPAPPRPRKRAADEELLARLAQYEELMRKNNVDYSEYANTWVSSGLDEGEEKKQVKVAAAEEQATHGSSRNGHRIDATISQSDRHSWFNLSKELKFPPIQTIRHAEDVALLRTPSLDSIMSGSGPHSAAPHPDTKQIFHLWQRFVESVDPLTKIVHVPTLQKRVLEASWHLEAAARPLRAVMFAIFALAVTSMSEKDCLASLGESRDTLVLRYRAATLRALVAADFLTSTDLETLQALVLLIFADPESDLTTTLTSIAVSTAHKMGLHRASSSSSSSSSQGGSTSGKPLSPFDQEMRTRLWWPICGFWSRTGPRAAHPHGLAHTLREMGDARPPLNVNDAELHPRMAELPAAGRHDGGGATEMVCVLLKFELSSWLRGAPEAAAVFEGIMRGGSADGKVGREKQEGVVDELAAIHWRKYLRYLDRSVPLHGLAYAMAVLAIARMRFKIHHPRSRAHDTAPETVALDTKESDLLFESAVTIVEMVDYGARSNFSMSILRHLSSGLQVDVLVWVVSELRRRTRGDRVVLAWKLVEGLFDEYPDLLRDDDFYVALADLVLEAWESRKGVLLADGALDEAGITPRFIRELRGRRQPAIDEGAESLGLDSSFPLDTAGSSGLEGLELNWEYWDDFLRI